MILGFFGEDGGSEAVSAFETDDRFKFRLGLGVDD